MNNEEKQSFSDLLELAELTYYSFGGGLVITYRESDIEKFKSAINKAKEIINIH